MSPITSLGLTGTPWRARNAWAGILPIVHGLPQLIYNGVTVNFPKDIWAIQNEQSVNGTANRAASGLVEYLGVSLDIGVNIKFRNFKNADATDAALRLDLEQWDVWAQLRLPWTFALDRGEQILTTLAGAAAAGDTIIQVATTDYIQEGALYVIRSKTVKDTVKILTVDSAAQVTLTKALGHSYENGDRFRSKNFWPCRLSSDSGYKTPIIEMPPLDFDVEFYADEDMN